MGNPGAVGELQVPGAGRPGLRWGWWILGQGQAEERPDLPLSTHLYSAGLDMLPSPYPGPPPGLHSVEDGPRVPHCIKQGTLSC